MARLLGLLRRPPSWAVLAGLGLLVALSLPYEASGALFWSAVVLSCAGAAGAVLTAGFGAEPGPD